MKGRLRVAASTRCGELLPPFEGRKDDRDGSPKARRVGLVPLGQDWMFGRCDVLIVLSVCGARHAFWRREEGAIGRLASRATRGACIEADFAIQGLEANCLRCVGWRKTRKLCPVPRSGMDLHPTFHLGRELYNCRI